MIFPKHPNVMTEEELSKWAKTLIELKTPESNTIDYKEIVSISNKNNRIEIARDVSSFANEHGGILLYGVPQTEEEVPVPKDISECGIEIPEQITVDIENILLDIVKPILPELTIKVIKINETNQSSLLMIYHPESWGKPHMVEGYNHGRYYRRGNFRTVLMNEHQIEAAYLARKASLQYAETFFESNNFKPIPKDGKYFRVIICPRMALLRKDLMFEETFRVWLTNNMPAGRRGNWLPFLNGWLFKAYAGGGFYEDQYEVRLFHNGAVCFTCDLDLILTANGKLYLPKAKDVLQEYVIEILLNLMKFFQISCPLAIDISLHNVKGLELSPKYDRMDFCGYDSPVEAIDTNTIKYAEETSVNEILYSGQRVIHRLMRRLVSSFGVIVNFVE